MKRSASEIIRNLERRIARLERQAGHIPHQLKPFLKELEVAVQIFEEKVERKSVDGPITITFIDFENNVERGNRHNNAYVYGFTIKYKDSKGKSHFTEFPVNEFDSLYYDTDEEDIDIDKRDFLRELKNKVYLN